MYIVKLSENKVEGHYNGIPNLLDAHHEIDSLEDALELRKRWINEYPFLVKVEIFKSEKIDIIDNLQEEAMDRRQEYWDKVEYYQSLGFNGYKELDENSKVIFEF